MMAGVRACVRWPRCLVRWGEWEGTTRESTGRARVIRWVCRKNRPVDFVWLRLTWVFQPIVEGIGLPMGSLGAAMARHECIVILRGRLSIALCFDLGPISVPFGNQNRYTKFLKRGPEQIITPSRFGMMSAASRILCFVQHRSRLTLKEPSGPKDPDQVVPNAAPEAKSLPDRIRRRFLQRFWSVGFDAILRRSLVQFSLMLNSVLDKYPQHYQHRL